MSKDAPVELTSFEQLKALGLNDSFPDLSPERLTGIKPPSMGEINLLFKLFRHDPIPDNIINHVRQLISKNKISFIIPVINTWNRSPEWMKSIVTPRIANEIANKLAECTFGNDPDKTDLYKSNLLLATGAMINSSQQGPTL